MQCECCKEPIYVGSSFVMLYGRPWKSQHAVKFRNRRMLAKK